MTATQAAADTKPQDGPQVPMHPSDLLLQLIVAFLAPMFMSASTGDLSFARLAALETIISYGARTQAELMNIAQIIAFGLAAMDSLWLSMADDVSLTMKIRLRSTANGLNRSAQQNQRVLDRRRLANPTGERVIAEQHAIDEQPAPMPDEDAIAANDVEASIENARALVKAARVRIAAQRADQPPAAEPAPAQPPAAPPELAQPVRAGQANTSQASATRAFTEQQRNLMWADAMTQVAGELSANLANVPSAQRRSDQMWASALGSSASSLAVAASDVPLSGKPAVQDPDKPSKPA